MASGGGNPQAFPLGSAIVLMCAGVVLFLLSRGDPPPESGDEPERAAQEAEAPPLREDEAPSLEGRPEEEGPGATTAPRTADTTPAAQIERVAVLVRDLADGRPVPGLALFLVGDFDGRMPSRTPVTSDANGWIEVPVEGVGAIWSDDRAFWVPDHDAARAIEDREIGVYRMITAAFEFAWDETGPAPPLEDLVIQPLTPAAFPDLEAGKMATFETPVKGRYEVRVPRGDGVDLHVVHPVWYALDTQVPVPPAGVERAVVVLRLVRRMQLT
ncbi:MAG: hypothetical protein ACYTG6_14550, partial [Planctomycetota bacterium]